MYRSTSLFVLLLAKETAVTKYTTTASNAQALITMHTTRRAMEAKARVTGDLRSIPAPPSIPTVLPAPGEGW